MTDVDRRDSKVIDDKRPDGGRPVDGKRVYVAGHKGMVGSALVRRLQRKDCEVLTADRRELDLKDPAATHRWLQARRPDVVFVAAATVGGIVANSSRPVDFLEDNLLIELALTRAAFDAGVEKLVFLGSSCIYPRMAPQPITEDALLTGPLEATNEWYAIAKIAGIKLCQAFRRQHGADFISAMPCNLYGINDNFDLTSSHVLPALIRKAHTARATGEPLVVWGTGTPRREFLEADDAADAVVFLAEHYSGDAHVNVGSGSDLSIRELVGIICEVVGFDGPVEFDASKPDGTPRKLMDSSALFELGWQPTISLRDGIGKLYAWFLEHVDSGPPADRS